MLGVEFVLSLTSFAVLLATAVEKMVSRTILASRQPASPPRKVETADLAVWLEQGRGARRPHHDPRPLLVVENRGLGPARNASIEFISDHGSSGGQSWTSRKQGLTANVLASGEQQAVPVELATRSVSMVVCRWSDELGDYEQYRLLVLEAASQPRRERVADRPRPHRSASRAAGNGDAGALAQRESRPGAGG